MAAATGLRTQRRLVVLDNCEHLRVGCANVVARLLSRCPPLVVLATSGESLGVPGEVTWRVPSLSFPWPERPPAVDDVNSYEALALFLDRARAARPGMVVAPEDVAALTSICYHLDGIPLGLELAAARVRAMSMREIAERIAGRFDLLAAGGAGPPRHQTLHASVEWSYQLLDGVEQAMLRRLGVFAGGWSLETAEVVVGGAPVDDAEVAGVLARLVDKSLVQVEQSGGESRYRLLETIRVFAHERLAEAGEAGAVPPTARGAFRRARQALRGPPARPRSGRAGTTARPGGRQLPGCPGVVRRGPGPGRAGVGDGAPGCGSSGISGAGSWREQTGWSMRSLGPRSRWPPGLRPSTGWG